jgi:hypothetical protein
MDPDFPAQVGDQLELWAQDSDATFNLHRLTFGMRYGQMEEKFIGERLRT